jgi:hypothetical protein
MIFHCEKDSTAWTAVAAAKDEAFRAGFRFQENPPDPGILAVERAQALHEAVNAAADKLPGKAGTRSMTLYGADGKSCSLIASHSYADGHAEVWHVEAYDNGQFKPGQIDVRVRGPWTDNHDQHWERVRRAFDPAKQLIADGQFYSIGSENAHCGARGFGGRRFRFRRLADDSIVESTNMWSGGTIPPAWRDRLPDTAVMLAGSHPVYMG